MTISYLIYISAVVLSVFFAFLAQKFKKSDKPQPIFIFMSMLPLIFIMGFRDVSIGVDGYSYLNGYINANSTNIFQYYGSNITEPGFYVLYKISYFLGDFQWLFILTATITICFFYKAMSYEINNISFALVIFIFATTQYFYYFGILRMGIAVSIIAFAYRYIIENDKKKFIIFVGIATMFHYSALFSFILLFLSKNNQNVFKRNNILKIVLMIPVSFFVIKYLVFPFITADRYQGYIASSGIIGTSFVSSLPLLLVFLIFFNKSIKNNRNYRFYFFLFVIKVITEIFAPIIGIGRMVWYVNLSIVFLFPSLIKMCKERELKFLVFILIVSYCLLYSYSAYFGESFRGSYMLPYKIFFGE
ncbi:EpsG family protein [Planococcus donghaensis]|uniref:EpsG family protein n=1 Tax=Planococcus donghaensis TaxID=414778 RepID=A0A1C7EFL6_9BACL|nr:EpsG family protein [Planococcus donghaensis]ANU22485.1 hypothetical protein BCM40_03555 [Planococcus donghaensis]